MTASIDIVIVNWNSGHHLVECLASIEKGLCDEFQLSRVIVVDNSSTDGSLESVRPNRLPLTVVLNKKNEGFAKACNQGASLARSDYILFLNPDAVLFDNSIAGPLGFMESDAGASYGVCGIQLLDEKGDVVPTCAEFPSLTAYAVKAFGLNRIAPGFFRTQLMTNWDHRSSREVDQVIGAFLMIRTEVFRQLGGFDERFFVYLEEVDLAKRMRALGYRSYYFADAQAYHKGCGTSDQVRATRLAYNIRSRLLYGAKHFGVLQSILLALLILFVEPLTRLVHAGLRLSAKEISEVAAGYIKTYRGLPGILKAMVTNSGASGERV